MTVRISSGFMGVHDVEAGMKIAVSFTGEDGAKEEYLGEVVGKADKEVFAQIDNSGQELVGHKEKYKVCQLRIIVDNVLYSWEEVNILPTHGEEQGNYKLYVETHPQVFNRRKYPRMPQDSEAIKEYVEQNYSE